MLYETDFCTDLEAAEFRLHSSSVCGLYFFRKRKGGHHQAVVINQSGSESPAFYAYAVVSFLNHGYLYKELCVIDLITEIANDSGRGWTEIHSRKEAQEWGRSLVNALPGRFRELESSQLEELSANSAESRAAASKYVALLSGDVKRGEESKRIAGMPGVCQVPDAVDLYTRVVDTILQNQEVVDPGIDFSMLKPIESVEFMRRIQLVADFLFWRDFGGDVNRVE
ncbi:hypothetical protein [Stieleria varia]|uniref:Uncharacterized protein n=1 Tax=Stieleria varia TaxID=2528005 RepID=A0A5C6AY60_9BACT|nr:hypothetical protein [Stieleria varia]TWU04407.1 hypothetical protein Pla52n_24470 [Stieleria varia]